MNDVPGSKLTAAKIEVMKAIPFIAKQSSPGLKFPYASEEAIVSACQAAFVTNGLSLSPVAAQILERREYASKSGAQMVSTTVCVQYELAHVSGERQTLASLGEASDSSDKSLPKAMTQAYKYVLRQAFLLPTGDDPDRHQSGGERGAGRNAEPPPQQQKPSDPDRVRVALAKIGAAATMDALTAIVQTAKKWFTEDALKSIYAAANARAAVLKKSDNPPVEI